MTREEVSRRVDQIARRMDDDQEAHGAEDRLYADVLQAIADGAEDAAGLATEALKSKDFSFSRWCG